MKEIQIYVKTDAAIAKSLSKHIGFLEGVHRTFFMEHAEELKKEYFGNLGEVMMGFSIFSKTSEEKQKESNEPKIFGFDYSTIHRFQKYDFVMLLGDYFPDEYIKRLVKCIDNGDYLIEVKDTEEEKAERMKKISQL